MVECTFCDGHSITELWLDDKRVGRMCLNLCDECTSAYDSERQNWETEAANAE